MRKKRKKMKQNSWGRKATEAARFWDSVLGKRPEESTSVKDLFIQERGVGKNWWQ